MDRVPLACLLDYIEAEGFRGHDPYDALNSPVLRFLSFRRKFLRLAFIQLLKRLPVNLRPLILPVFAWMIFKEKLLNSDLNLLDELLRQS